MKIGYARVSTKDQELGRQIDILKEKGCDKIFSEKVSGVSAKRPQLELLKEVIRPGDAVIIESWSRLSRSTKELYELVDYFQDNDVQIISIKENFDTSTPQGKLMLTMFQAFAEFEHDLIVERVKEGLSAARARGRKGGRPKVDQGELKKAIELYDTQLYTVREITEKTGIKRATLYNYLRKRKES